ncbi:MAG: LytTR family transcriptional regulator DNA-binding domain-containing protein [bacterium]|nr:LytTR family transcriptional regulator DNA-binding domain-containing protein [bacterium]
MKRIVIVEDEALIADHLALLLVDLKYEVLAIVDSADELFAVLDTSRPDLVLLDIQIQGALDGVDISHVLNSKYELPFVFISSNTDDKTLSRVKHANPAGFISKPFKVEQLRSVLALLPAKKPDAKQEEINSHFFVKDALGHVRLAYEDVLYAKADDNYTHLHTKDKRYVLSATLKKTEEQLASHGFIRCHRSYLVNLKKIERLGGNFVLIGNEEIPVSETLRKNIVERLDLL